MTFGQKLEFLSRNGLLLLFPIASFLIAPILLTALPQGEEILRTITDDALLDPLKYINDFPRVIWFFVGLIFWGLANWYSARMVLQRDFSVGRNVTGVMKGAGQPFERGVRKWAPRAFIFLGFIPFVVKMASFGQIAIAMLILLVGVALAIFVLARRRMFRSLSDANDPRGDMPEGEEVAVQFFVGLSVLIFLLLFAVNYSIARWIGASGILLIQLAAITLNGTTLLVYVPKLYGYPSMIGAAVALSVLLSVAGATDNHGIASRRIDQDAQSRVERRTAGEQLDEWKPAGDSAHCDPKHCGDDGFIVLVAAEGGASRSGWWSAHVLSVLDDLTDGRFGNQVFAISGISGGSLGIATWVSLHRQAKDLPQPTSVRLPTDRFPPKDEDCEYEELMKSNSYARKSACFLGGDFVSTTLGYLLGADLLQRFVPFAVDNWDRSRGLEVTWSRDWQFLFHQNDFSRPLLDLYKRRSSTKETLIDNELVPQLRTDIPMLILNSASVNRGRPVVESPVKISFAEVEDLLSPNLRTSGLTLSGAVHNSARFPLVSPGGDVMTADGTHFDALVDGGYIENSGALGLTALLQSVCIDRWSKSCDQLEEKEAKEWEKTVRDRIVIVFIANDPSETVVNGQELCEMGSKPVDLHEQPRWGEGTTPLIGLFNARGSRADSSRRALIRELGLCAGKPDAKRPRRVYFVSMASPMVKEQNPAMSWYMTPQSRATMWRAVATRPALSEVRNLASLFNNDVGEVAARLNAYGDEQ